MSFNAPPVPPPTERRDGGRARTGTCRRDAELGTRPGGPDEGRMDNRLALPRPPPSSWARTQDGDDSFSNLNHDYFLKVLTLSPRPTPVSPPTSGRRVKPPVLPTEAPGRLTRVAGTETGSVSGGILPR